MYIISQLKLIAAGEPHRPPGHHGDHDILCHLLPLEANSSGAEIVSVFLSTVISALGSVPGHLVGTQSIADQMSLEEDLESQEAA